MYLCSTGHDEICHEGRTCPACELQDKLTSAEEYTSHLESEKKDLENEEKRLNEKIDELDTKIMDLERREK